MPSAKDPNNGKSQHNTNTESAMSAGAMEQVKDFYMQRAAKVSKPHCNIDFSSLTLSNQIKKLYATDQYETSAIHSMRVRVIEHQFEEFEKHKREVM